jgi:hypothetical protein
LNRAVPTTSTCLAMAYLRAVALTRSETGKQPPRESFRTDLGRLLGGERGYGRVQAASSAPEGSYRLHRVREESESNATGRLLDHLSASTSWTMCSSASAADRGCGHFRRVCRVVGGSGCGSVVPEG